MFFVQTNMYVGFFLYIFLGRVSPRDTFYLDYLFHIYFSCCFSFFSAHHQDNRIFLCRFFSFVPFFFRGIEVGCIPWWTEYVLFLFIFLLFFVGFHVSKGYFYIFLGSVSPSDTFDLGYLFDIGLVFLFFLPIIGTTVFSYVGSYR